MRYLVPVAVVVLALLGINAIYVVGEGHAAVLTRFGQVEATGIAPGLHFKLPFVEGVSVYDTRAITVQSEPLDCTTREGESVRVGFFVRWRVADPDAYYRATAGDELQVSRQMAPAIDSALRAQVGAHSLAELIVADGGPIDDALRATVGATLRAKLGIDILEVGVERVLPPDATLAAIYKRMNAQASARAGTLRDAGAAAAAAIRAKGDVASQQVLAEADRKAATVRGAGDAAAAKIYAQAAQADPGFFNYWSALQTWRKTFDAGGAVVVLGKDSPLVQAIDAGAAGSDAPNKH